MEQREYRANGNIEAIKLLKNYVTAAEREPSYKHVAVSMIADNGVVSFDYVGETHLECIQRDMLKQIHGIIDTSINKWTYPTQNPNLDSSYVCYNIAHGPLGFDFIIWLITCEMTRVRDKSPGPLKVAFWKGLDADDRMQKSGRQGWLDNVFKPSLQFVGAVEDETAVRGHHREIYIPAEIVASYNNGEKLPEFKSGPIEDTKQLDQHKDKITITLREAEYWSHRNSNLSGWFKFAEDLIKKGYEVVFVRDTAKANLELPYPGVVSCPEASLDLNKRLYLYENSKANLFVSNGPSCLALFGNRPWITFTPINPDGHSYSVNTPSFWKRFQGVEVGSQYPWSTEKQMIAWCPDSYENISEYWEKLCL